MPFGRRSKGVKNALDTATNNSVSWSAHEILPKEVRATLRKIYSRAANGIGVKIDTAELEKLVIGIDERVKNANGKIYSFEKSSGGKKASGLDKTIDIGIVINNILILEPVGQVDNATFVGDGGEFLLNSLRKNGRQAAANKGLLRRISHKQIFNSKIGKNDYDFGTKDASGKYVSSHIFDLIDYASNYPQEFIRSVNANAGRTITRKKSN